MTATIITLPVDAIIERLGHGKLWARSWGVPTNPTEPTCLHGAIRFCAPVPGDAYLIEQVGARFGFGVRDNDDAADFAAVEVMVRSHADITDDMLADTFGPQWEPIVALVRRAAVLTAEELQSLAADWDAAWAAAWDAAGAAAGAAAWDAAWDAAGAAARAAAGAAAGAAARALVVRDLIGQHGFEQRHYDVLTGPWAAVIGPVHPDDVAHIVAGCGVRMAPLSGAR